MPPKKGGQNGFYYFFLELRQKHPNLYRTNEQAASAAGPLWKEMDAEKRRPYDEKARILKNKDKVRYTSSGQNVEVLQRQQEEEKRKIQDMKEEIENTILAAVEANTLPDKEFYIIHVNYFCVCHKQYYPAEIAVVRWNLRFGVKEDNVFHMMCKPGSLPVGYSAEAIKISEDTHKIPPPSSNEHNLKDVAFALDKFIANRNVPLYASDKNAPVVANVIQQLSDAFGIPEYRIFSLQHLFFTLRNSSSKGKVWIASSFAQTELETDRFEFCRETACSFHVNVDLISHCSQSVAIRTVYTIANNCCANMGIDLISGQHVPKTAQIRSTRTSSHASSSLSSNNSSSWEPSRRRQPLQAGYLSRGETEPSELSDTSTMIDPNENYDGSEDEWHIAKPKKKHTAIASNSQSSDYTQTSGSKLRRPVALSSALAGVSLSNEPRGRGRGIGANYSNAKK